MTAAGATIPPRLGCGIDQLALAFVLAEPFVDAAALADELKRFVKGRLAPYKYPRWVAFVDELPRTATGKLQRFKLRSQTSASST